MFFWGMFGYCGENGLMLKLKIGEIECLFSFFLVY